MKGLLSRTCTRPELVLGSGKVAELLAATIPRTSALSLYIGVSTSTPSLLGLVITTTRPPGQSAARGIAAGVLEAELRAQAAMHSVPAAINRRVSEDGIGRRT